MATKGKIIFAHRFSRIAAVLFTGAIVTAALATQGQSFVNLNFEMANVPDVPTNQPGSMVSVTLGMPGWAFYDNEAGNQIGHNNFSAGGAFVVIEGPSWDSLDILQGHYTAYVIGSSAGPQTSAYIEQTGQIPVGSLSIQFYVNQTFAPLQVSFAGNIIPTEQIGIGPNYYIMGGDVSAYAGQTGDLRFTALPGTGGDLDNIIFSPSPVPEPATCALILGGAILWSAKWRQKGK